MFRDSSKIALVWVVDLAISPDMFKGPAMCDKAYHGFAPSSYLRLSGRPLRLRSFVTMEYRIATARELSFRIPVSIHTFSLPNISPVNIFFRKRATLALLTYFLGSGMYRNRETNLAPPRVARSCYI